LQDGTIRNCPLIEFPLRMVLSSPTLRDTHSSSILSCRVLPG
jgi:hypothetical protein